jgi:thiol-disulfide isomerase/thioredoxin
MRYGYWWVVMLLLSFPVPRWAEDGQVPDKALCPVCALKGETEPEKVKAHSEHDGQTHYFCSQTCREEFETDPLAYLPPVLPRPAPAITVESLASEDASLQDFAGKMVLVDFWATWCKPCLKTMPELQRLYEAYVDSGFVVVGISIDEGEDRAKKVKKWVDKIDVSYPIFLDAKETPAWHMFRVKAIPALFLISREGQVVAQWRGEIDHQELKSGIGRRLGGQAVD